MGHALLDRTDGVTVSPVQRVNVYGMIVAARKLAQTLGSEVVMKFEWAAREITVSVVRDSSPDALLAAILRAGLADHSTTVGPCVPLKW